MLGRAHFALCGVVVVVILLAIAEQQLPWIMGSEAYNTKEKSRSSYRKARENSNNPVAYQNSTTAERPVQPLLSTIPNWLFQDSVIARTTDGAYTVTNVCVAVQNRVKFYTLNSRNGTGLGLPSSAPDPFYVYMKGTQGTVLEDWTMVVLNRSYVVDQAAIWLDDVTRNAPHLDGNPAHCLNDLVFSLASDWMASSSSSSSQEDDTRIATATATATATPLYSAFMYGHQGGIRDTITSSICGNMLSKMFGFIPPSDSGIVTEPFVCFKSLTIPKVANIRHARNAHTNEALQQAQQRMFNLTRPFLDSSPWPSSSPSPALGNETLTTTTTPTIFLYDRSETSRRRLANSTQMKEMLEELYHVNVDIWNEQWGQCIKNLTKQALIYNSQQYILSPHGAHLTNLIFTRPGTRVLEVQCFMSPRRPRRVHQQWFANWAPVVGIQYSKYTENVGCQENGVLLANYSPQWITIVEIEKLVTQAALHFGLRTRQSTITT